MRLLIDRPAQGRDLREHAVRVVAAVAARMAPLVEKAARDALGEALVTSPEHDSLLSGGLRNLFGLEDPEGVLSDVVDAVRGSVRSALKGPSGDVLGGLTVHALRADMSEALSARTASYTSFSKRRGTETLVPWLSWLLLEGDRVILADWEAHTARGSYAGTRTGGAVMVQPTKRPPRGFQVPAEFSGVLRANWLTRCVDAASPKIGTAIERALADASR